MLVIDSKTRGSAAGPREGQQGAETTSRVSNSRARRTQVRRSQGSSPVGDDVGPGHFCRLGCWVDLRSGAGGEGEERSEERRYYERCHWVLDKGLARAGSGNTERRKCVAVTVLGKSIRLSVLILRQEQNKLSERLKH